MSQTALPVGGLAPHESDQAPKPLSSSATARSRSWLRAYRARVVVTDVVVILAAMAVPFAVLRAWDVDHARVPFLLVASLVWAVSLAAFDSRSPRTIGTGTTEYKVIVDATLVAIGIVALIAFSFGTTVSRSDVFPSVPLGLVLLLVGRWSWRQWLRRERTAGRSLDRAVLVGSPSGISHTAAQLERHPDAGYRVVGSLVAEEDTTQLHERLAVALESSGADTVMLTSSDALTAERIRGLAWNLERHDYRLVITPSLVDVAESRIQTQPVAGLPLIHVQSPTYTGPQRVAKRFVDVVGSGLLLVLFSPILLTVAILVKATSPGPVFYRQERIGRSDGPFSILKFRSMIVDADSRLQSLLAEQGTADSPLFKITEDPRLTRVGAILRRYSLDELPQLINVLTGDMSLVGPRPQRPAEVALYDDAAHRRLKVRPGMTGLWQVSGRSRLAWEESLRLDLYYIENWTLMVDAVILWRTFKAVVGSDGAY